MQNKRVWLQQLNPASVKLDENQVKVFLSGHVTPTDPLTVYLDDTNELVKSTAEYIHDYNVFSE